ncbi:hypothetical protein NM208_g10527 [Fusarium decemcellulare]|uniref:Uncharacterized protein n=1 Tax=Fusarium decemcellulare TaxID=57161 RepID=A0ACC1RXN3_9HYPO|nr:hypothetical protein NM208_g10527 [Fusarium decemcellulare]
MRLDHQHKGWRRIFGVLALIFPAAAQQQHQRFSPPEGQEAQVIHSQKINPGDLENWIAVEFRDDFDDFMSYD